MRREMPYYRLLARGLAMAPHRGNAAGETELSDLDAATLRNCGFPDGRTRPVGDPAAAS